jgi:hypothetical protein
VNIGSGDWQQRIFHVMKEMFLISAKHFDFRLNRVIRLFQSNEEFFDWFLSHQIGSRAESDDVKAITCD